jgi:hypothetical protein
MSFISCSDWNLSRQTCLSTILLFVLLAITSAGHSQEIKLGIENNGPGYVGDCTNKLFRDEQKFAKPNFLTKEQFTAMINIGIDMYTSGKDLDSAAIVEKFKVTQFYIQHCGEYLSTNGPLLGLTWEGESRLPHISNHGLSFFEEFNPKSKKRKQFSFSPVRMSPHACYLRSELMSVLGDVLPSPTSNRDYWNLIWKKSISAKERRVLSFVATFFEDCLRDVTLISELKD